MLKSLFAASLAASLAYAAPANAAEPSNPAALQKVTAETSVLVYVDYVTGLDNLINTIPASCWLARPARNAFAPSAQLT